MKTEPLFTCPLCKTANFTKRGLSSHVCRKNDRKPLAPADLEKGLATPQGPGGKPSAAPDANQEPNYLAYLTTFAARKGQPPIVRPSRDNADRTEAMKSTTVAWVFSVYGVNEDDAANAAARAFANGEGLITHAGEREGLTFPISPRPAAQTADTEASQEHAASPGKFGAITGSRAPAGVLAVAEDDEDALMGAQLTAQWERVKGSRKEDLIFGAMMLKLRERIDSARGADQRGHAKFAKGTGLAAWLKTNAPLVSESIAYRLMEIVEGISEDFHLKKIDLEMLLGAQIEGLDAKLQKKRAQIEEVIEGRSQRQLLLEFGRAADGRSKNPGGFRPNALLLYGWLEQEFPGSPEYLGVDFCDLPKEVQARFKAEGQRYEQTLSKAQREELETAADARAWNEQIVPALVLGIDQQFYLRATEAQRAELLTALTDLLEVVKGHDAACAGKKPKKGLPAK